MAKQRPEVAGVRFLNSGRIAYVDSRGLELHVGDWVAVETGIGREAGRVIITPRQIRMNLHQGDLLPIDHLLNDDEVTSVESNPASFLEVTRVIGGPGRRDRFGPDLGHEYKRNVQLKAIMPSLGQRVVSPRGPGVVESLQIHKELATVRLDADDQVHTFARAELGFTRSPS